MDYSKFLPKEGEDKKPVEKQTHSAEAIQPRTAPERQEKLTDYNDYTVMKQAKMDAYNEVLENGEQSPQGQREFTFGDGVSIAYWIFKWIVLGISYILLLTPLYWVLVVFCLFMASIAGEPAQWWWLGKAYESFIFALIVSPLWMIYHKIITFLFNMIDKIFGLD